ncbi:TIGR04076 family protein [soil metagenome]
MSQEFDSATDDSSGNDMELYDIRVTVDSIEGRSVCGMKVGDFCEVTESSKLSMPGHFCFYALQSVLPLIPAKQRKLPDGDWLERDALVACPDPEERLIMRIERGELKSMNSGDLT